MKKRKPSPWLLLLIFVAATLLMNFRYWLPITADSGEHYTLTLEQASASKSVIYLRFDGKSKSFHLPYSEAFTPLLEPEALGKEYHVIAVYHATGKHSRSYYDVYALSGADGTEYLTIEQSEAIRQAMLPKRLGLTLALSALVCPLIIFRIKRSRTKEEQSP